MCTSCSPVSVPRRALLEDMVALCVTLRDNSKAPKPYLTSQPVCKSLLSCQCFLTKSKEDAASKGSSRCFQKHEMQDGAGML